MSGQWELYYHANLAGRAEFVRLIFEEAGVPYKEINDDNIIRGQLMAGKFPGFPVFAPPVVKKGDFVLSQTPVISKYLGREFGLYPTGDEDVWRADQLVTTIHDFVAEGRLVFHARGFTESYYTQKEETKGHIEWFKKERFHKWMGMLERSLSYNNGGHGYAVGDRLTYVDLSLLQVLRGAESSFPETYQAQIDDFPLLKAHRARTESRPNLQAYFKSPRSHKMRDNSMM